MIYHPIRVKETLDPSKTNPSKLDGEHGFAHIRAGFELSVGCGPRIGASR